MAESVPITVRNGPFVSVSIPRLPCQRAESTGSMPPPAGLTRPGSSRDSYGGSRAHSKVIQIREDGASPVHKASALRPPGESTAVPTVTNCAYRPTRA